MNLMAQYQAFMANMARYTDMMKAQNQQSFVSEQHPPQLNVNDCQSRS